jgi:hypothetical protein
VELAELVQDPGFRQRMRKMAEYHAAGSSGDGPAPETGMAQGFAQRISALVGPARQRGATPQSPEAAQVVGRLLNGMDAARRAYVRERLQAGVDSQSDRYHELLGVINGQQARPSHAANLEWLLAAIDSEPFSSSPRLPT